MAFEKQKEEKERIKWHGEKESAKNIVCYTVS